VKDPKTPAKRPPSVDKASDAFSAEERAAMQELVKEQRAAARRSPRDARVEGERDVLAKIAEMPDADRVLAERIHALVTATAPDLVPKTWYGMPAYARDGKVVCFFQAAAKFKARYATFGFNEDAHLDDGVMWPTSFALTAMTAETEARIIELVKQATS
jgi:uncharacterized protein YdhG (YjbR/CyaY superfamily)